MTYSPQVYGVFIRQLIAEVHKGQAVGRHFFNMQGVGLFVAGISKISPLVTLAERGIRSFGAPGAIFKDHIRPAQAVAKEIGRAHV